MGLEAKQIHLFSGAEQIEKECRYIGEVIGSQGHWYSYLFTTNINITQGAINHLKNEAWFLGANSVYPKAELTYVTSTTIMGLVYDCPERNELSSNAH